MTALETVISIRDLTISRDKQIKLLNDYARLQIEKDREETIKTCLLRRDGDVANRIRNIPIELD